MYLTINEILNQYTTLSKPQLDRNYYQLPEEYKQKELIRLKNGLREIDISILPEIIYRKRKREFNENDIPALLYNNWSYYGEFHPTGNKSIEYCKVIMEHLFRCLEEKHKSDVRLIFFIRRSDNFTYVHYLLQVDDMTNIKQVVENYLKLISECETIIAKYDKDFITKDLLQNQECWGYLER
jgi:hypothetical protein